MALFSSNHSLCIVAWKYFRTHAYHYTPSSFAVILATYILRCTRLQSWRWFRLLHWCRSLSYLPFFPSTSISFLPFPRSTFRFILPQKITLHTYRPVLRAYNTHISAYIPTDTDTHTYIFQRKSRKTYH